MVCIPHKGFFFCEALRLATRQIGLMGTVWRSGRWSQKPSSREPAGRQRWLFAGMLLIRPRSNEVIHDGDAEPAEDMSQ